MAKVVNYIGFTLSFLIFVAFFLFPVAAQQISDLIVKGKVLDEKTGEYLVGANVFSTAQNTGSVTDTEGKFELLLKSFPVILSVSYLGYKEKRITVNDNSSAVVVYLLEDAGELNEVVVVGYGTQRRKELTGAIATVSKATLEYNAFNSVDLLLSGAVSGVNVTQSSGQPGAPAKVNIRGNNSINASNNPLYVIDGFLFFGDDASTKAGMSAIESELNPLSLLNSADIESIEILKDVSATAIYGSRGANGVIIVTTKKGNRDKASVNYHYSTGWDAPAKKIDLLNASQWARIQKDFFFNKGKYTDDEIAALGAGYNWQGAVLQTGVKQTHNLSISGGNDLFRYLFSGNYTDQTGIVINSGFRRYGGRLNIESKLSDKLTVGIAATAGKSVQNSITTFEEVTWSSSPFGSGITNSLVYALFVPPVVPIYAENGVDYNYHNPYEYGYLTLNGTTANPVSDLRNSIAENINATLLGNFFARYEITDGLSAKINAGTYLGYATQNYFSPSYSALGLNFEGIGGVGKRQQETRLAEYTLSYIKQLNDNNLIDILAGYTTQHTDTKYLINMTTAFTDETHGIDYLALGTKPSHPVSVPSKDDLSSVLGRINYSLLERYNLTLTFRGDKSSHFPAGRKWGYFPSAGFSWNISEEPFCRSLPKYYPRLRYRISYGSVGNQEIDAYKYAQTFTAGFYNGQGLLTQTNLGNTNLKWETTRQFNTGIDAGWLNDRITLTADLYRTKTYDVLMSLPVDPSLAVKEQLFNAGNTSNSGWEAALNIIPIDNKNIRWSVAFNIAKNKNRIDKIDGDRQKIVLGNNGEEILKVGESLGSFYGLKFDGIVQKGEDTSTLPTTVHGTPRPGDVKFVDLSGADGKPDDKIDNNDLTVIGSVQPDYIFGFQSRLNYRNFDLFISLQGTQGNEVFNSLRRYLETPNDSYNGSAALLDSWTENNPSNTMPALTNYRYYSYLDSRYVENASFLKLRNVSLGYELKVADFRGHLFVSAQNLFTLTKYKGYDPEISRGIDFGAYPSSRSFSIGINIKY